MRFVQSALFLFLLWFRKISEEIAVYLRVSYILQIGDKGMISVGKNCTRLTDLALQSCERCSVASYIMLSPSLAHTKKQIPRHIIDTHTPKHA